MKLFQAAFWQGWGRGAPPPEPTLARVLEAHLEALVSRAPVQTRGSLRVLNSEQRLVVEAGLSRVEVFVEPEGGVRAMIPVDLFLPGLLPLDPARLQVLGELGAARAVDSAYFAFRRGATAAALATLAEDLVRVLEEVIGEAPDASAVSLSVAPQVDNSSLLERMRELAKVRDYDTRRLVYQECVNAWFYLPLAEAEGVNAAPEPRQWKAEEGRVEWAIFTDQQALFDHHAAGRPFLVVSGIRLLRAAAHARVAALHINPDSMVGGQLLLNEIDTVADYLNSLGLRS